MKPDRITTVLVFYGQVIVGEEDDESDVVRLCAAKMHFSILS